VPSGIWDRLLLILDEFRIAVNTGARLGANPPRQITVTGQYYDQSTAKPPPRSDDFTLPTFINMSDPVYNGFRDSILQVLQPLHNEHKIQIQIDQDNRLAHEVQQLYCELKKVERFQAISLSQLSGLLAANSFGLGQCQRLTGSGQTFIYSNVVLFELMSQLKKHRVVFSRD